MLYFMTFPYHFPLKGPFKKRMGTLEKGLKKESRHQSVHESYASPVLTFGEGSHSRDHLCRTLLQSSTGVCKKNTPLPLKGGTVPSSLFFRE